MHQIRQILNPIRDSVVDLARVREYSFPDSPEQHWDRGDQKLILIIIVSGVTEDMAKYLQCSECGKLAFYYDDFVGTEKPFYRRFMRYPEGDQKYQPPRCFSCGSVPRLIHENIKEEKAPAKH